MPLPKVFGTNDDSPRENRTLLPLSMSPKGKIMVATKNGTPKPLRMGGEFKLDRVTQKGRKLPNRIILHAKAGWGKTSFAAQVPGIIFLMVGQETGLWTLTESGELPDNIAHFPQPAETKHEVEMALSELAVNDHPYKAVAIDSTTALEDILHLKACEDSFKGNWTHFNSFDAGPKEAAKEWDTIIRGLDQLRERGMGIILLGHSKVISFKNPEGPDYERWIGGVSKYSWDRLNNWADMVLFGNFETTVDKTNPGKTDAQTKGKGVGGQHRIILTEHHAAYDAKNRHGLPGEIDGGDSAEEAWKNFRSALAPNVKSKD